jgi:hypothetical protein
MFYGENIAICSESRTKHINALCGQNVVFVNVESGGK